MRLLLRTLMLLTSLAGATCASAADAISREDQFKAAYLFNFLKFVEWPASVPSDVITVCFVGASGLYDTLAPGIEEKRASSRRIALRRLEADAEPRGCHVVYIEGSVLARGATKALGDGSQPILTVSDAPHFSVTVGIIELFTMDNRLRFRINATHAHKVGLRISSSLLQLAAEVRKTTT